MTHEPCLCGDPECRRCFPNFTPEREDEDQQYERAEQRRIDAEWLREIEGDEREDRE